VHSIWWSTEQSGPAIGNLSAGTYTILVTDVNGCTASATAEVTEPTVLQTAVTPVDASCFGGANGTATAIPGGGTSPYQFLWSNGQTGALAQNLSVGTYQVTATDANGCTLTAEALIQQPTAVLVSMSSAAADCHGENSGSALAGATGGTPPYSYLWNTGQTTAMLSGLASGWYQLSVTDAQQCLQTNQVWVDQPLPLEVALQALPVSCPGVVDGSCTAKAEGGIGPYQYLWSNGDVGEGIQGLDQGTYSVRVNDANGCTATGTASVEVELYPEVTLGLDQTLLLGEEVLLVAQTNIPPNEILDYTWSGDGLEQQCPDCDQIRFLPLENGCERVLVRSIKGCFAEDEMCYRVTAKRRIYVPNVFTPNEDGENDYFTIYSDASVKEIRYLSVYSRWGEHLFQAVHFPTNVEQSGWHGDFRGQPMNPGVFVWVAEVEFIDGQVVLLKGDVTLLR
jgi:gliding motility-associated-like protein